MLVSMESDFIFKMAELMSRDVFQAQVLSESKPHNLYSTWNWLSGNKLYRKVLLQKVHNFYSNILRIVLPLRTYPVQENAKPDRVGDYSLIFLDLMV